MDTETAQDSDFMQTLAAMVAEDPTEPEQPVVATDPAPEPTSTKEFIEPAATTLVMEPKETKEPVQTVPVIAGRLARQCQGC